MSEYNMTKIGLHNEKNALKKRGGGAQYIVYIAKKTQYVTCEQSTLTYIDPVPDQSLH